MNEESLRRPIVTVGLTGRMLLEGPKTSENKEWSPSTDWAQGGPIIDREGISVCCSINQTFWVACTSRCATKGRTPLEAAMRAYAEDKLGPHIALPDTLRSGGGNEQA